jgi:hypothetical protein
VDPLVVNKVVVLEEAGVAVSKVYYLKMYGFQRQSSADLSNMASFVP